MRLSPVYPPLIFTKSYWKLAFLEVPPQVWLTLASYWKDREVENIQKDHPPTPHFFGEKKQRSKLKKTISVARSSQTWTLGHSDIKVTSIKILRVYQVKRYLNTKYLVNMGHTVTRKQVFSLLCLQSKLQSDVILRTNRPIIFLPLAQAPRLPLLPDVSDTCFQCYWQIKAEFTNKLWEVLINFYFDKLCTC